MSNLILENSYSFLNNFLGKFETSFYIEKPSEWANRCRTIPVGSSSYPGKVDMNITPHMIEIMDNAHPDSDIKSVTIMKSVQSTVTTMAESIVGHAIQYKLHNILMLISSKNIGKVRSSSALDVLIDYSGLSQYLKPMSTRNTRKINDNAFYKEFGSRRLMVSSYGSIFDLKSLSWSLIIKDEIDECPVEVGDQGDPESIIDGRSVTIRNSKTYTFSTPTNSANSRVYKNFLLGDQRYWYVPCPHCGEFQVLKLKSQGRNYGLNAEFQKDKDGHPLIIDETINYICEHCKQKFFEYQKPDIMLQGKWTPTQKPADMRFRSYHISGLMSPVMFYPWKNILSEFAGTGFGKDIMKMKAFTNNALGEPWENRARKKSWEYLRDRKTDFEIGEVPPGGIVITGGVDVQKDRLELQLVAWSYGMESFSFDYQIFHGDTSHYENDSWQSLARYALKTFKVYNSEVHISRIAIDTGHNPGMYRVKDWGQKAHTVYNFVSFNPLFIAVKGNDKKEDIILREKRISESIKSRYDLNVSLIKEDISLKLEIDSGPGALHFNNYSDEFFKQFLSEVYCEIEKGKWGWKKNYERNETWDTWIYARGAAEYMGLPSWSSMTWDEYKNSLLDIT